MAPGDWRALGLRDGAQMNFANKALWSLQGNHRDGVRDIVCRQDFRGVLRTPARKLRCHAAGTNGAHANSVYAQIFCHAPGQAK